MWEQNLVKVLELTPTPPANDLYPLKLDDEILIRIKMAVIVTRRNKFFENETPIGRKFK